MINHLGARADQSTTKEIPRPADTSYVKTVVVCDSEPVAMEGLRLLLQGGDAMRLVAAEGSPAEAMDAVRDLNPCLAVFDKGFGLERIMDCLRRLRDFGCDTRAVVWGSSISESDALRLLRAGASGVIRKSASLELLRECLDAVAAGRSWIEQGMIESAERPAPSRPPLTYRELQVLELVEQGMSNKAIAGELGIRIGTVKIHLRHIFEKTGIHGRYGLALSGLRARTGGNTAADGGNIPGDGGNDGPPVAAPGEPGSPRSGPDAARASLQIRIC
jgi:DNA-binding NarL/FixJ family response regulator